jgi:heme exporter protein C
MRRPYIPAFIFSVLALIGLAIAPYMALLYAGIEKDMGLAQKIFYYHVPCAFMMYAGFSVCFVSSILYLYTRKKSYDIWAYCGAEVGLLFCTLVLLTGPIWGTWWTWDAQLTLTLMLWLIYVSYMMLHSYSEDSLQSAKFRAVLSIVGFMDMPLIHYATKLWRTHHPQVIRGEKFGLPDDMKLAFYFCVFTFLMLFLALLFKRVSLEKARDALEALKADVRDRKAILGQVGSR